MTRRFSVVLSQGQTVHPDRQAFEQQLVSQLAQEGHCAVVVVPHLYDLDAHGPSLAAIREIGGDLIVLAWLYPRATRWILDRQGIGGQPGHTNLDDEELPSAAEPSPNVSPADAFAAIGDLPRRIYCFDLRRYETTEPYIEGIRQIVRADGQPTAVETSFLAQVLSIDEQVKRRWYPVIDFSRCTNCLECIDFCLFGVYGVDDADKVLVELPDHCRKGCPACSRVCPENAILFPQHKLPAIAGDLLEPGGLKMDLSSLFGAADDFLGARNIAARERDEHLLIAGQRPVGTASPPPAPQATGSAEKKDELDALIDQLDAMDL
jgi:NAD-dependent dihydropyrimidine dehydrogenase PreA subunit